MIFLMILRLHGKVLVIDDLNLSKNVSPDANRNLIKTIKDSVTSKNEEVVLLNKNKDLRISSKDFGLDGQITDNCEGKGVEIDTPVIEQVQLSKQIEKYEKSVKDLKNLVNKVESKKFTDYTLEKKRPRNLRVNYGPDYIGLLDNKKSKFQNTDTLPENDFYNDERNGLLPFTKSFVNLPPQKTMGNYLFFYNKKPKSNSFTGTSPNGSLGVPPGDVANVPKLEMLNALQDGSYSRMNEILSSFKNELSNFSNNQNSTGSSPFNPNPTNNNQYPSSLYPNNTPSVSNTHSFSNNKNSNDSFYPDNNQDPNESSLLNNVDPFDSSRLNKKNASNIENQIEDRLAYTKLKEQNNLIKAIDNRKEYIKMKLQEIKANKDKLSIEMNSYKTKVKNILNQIKSIKKSKDTLINQINTNKNHILNLNKNSVQVINRKEQVVSLIRITKNEVQRYRNLLENETNKLEMLEKQYEVYEETLKKYSDDIDSESHKLKRTSTELNKSGIDLENLQELYQEYSQKNHKIEEELRRYENIAVCLDSEEKKVMMNQLNGFVV